MSLYSVIGANFGDEGKGLVTDSLSSSSATVVRFNGGAQAGHTVVTPEGIRHVFRHFGSGSFTGATTFLSHFFVLNPILFCQEYKELSDKGLKPKVILDPRCIVSTPYDMLLNQAIEEQRGPGRHGSCGVGIGETIERCETEYITNWSQGNNAAWKEKLHRIRSEWVPKRAEELGITGTIPFLANDDMITRFLECLNMMQSLVTSRRSDFLHTHTGNVIFEGAQGLCLDMDSPFFPHVTRSKTDLTNVVELLKEMGRDKEYLNNYYVSRTYLTRHGAGPLPNEISSLPYPDVRDDTNMEGKFQGKLRFAYLDIDHLLARIRNCSRISEASGSVNINHLIITCWDQISDGVIKVVYGKATKTLTRASLRQSLPGFHVLTFNGRTRNHSTYL